MEREERRLSDRRAEETFAALSAGGGGPRAPRPEMPWKVATGLLLILALALPLAAGIRESRRAEAERVRIADAAEVAASAVVLARDGHLAEAGRALASAGLSVAEVPGLAEAGEAVRAAVAADRTRRETEKNRAEAALSQAARLAASQARAVEALRRGDLPGAALPASQDDSLSSSLRGLTEALASLGAALALVDGPAHAGALDAVAREWALPGLSAAAERATAQATRDLARRQALKAAAEAVRAGDVAAARRAVRSALQAAEALDLVELLPALERVDRAARAQALAAAAPSRPAAALYRVLALEGGGEPAARMAEALEAALDRETVGKALTAMAGELATADAGGRDRAAALLTALAKHLGTPESAEKARRARAEAHLARAKDLLARGFTDAALEAAALARREGAPDAGDLFRRIEEEASERDRAVRIGRTREAVEAGAFALAARLADGLTGLPEGLAEEISEGLEAQALAAATVAGERGNIEEAWRILEEADVEAPALRIRILFHAGDVEEALARVGDDPIARRAALYAAAAEAFVSDPAAAGALLARAREYGEAPAEFAAALATALDAADADDEARGFWAAVTAESERRRSPKEEPAPVDGR